MPECIGFPPQLVYICQGLVFLLALFSIIGALIHKEMDFSVRLYIIAFWALTLAAVFLIPSFAFAGIGTPGNLSNTGCDSAIFIGK